MERMWERGRESGDAEGEVANNNNSDLSLVLNITVRLALNPEVHAKRRSSSVAPCLIRARRRKER